jgi:hypothetical protein
MMPTNEITIEPSWVGRNGTATITIRQGDSVLALEKLDLSKSASREKFVVELCKCRPGIDAGAIREELLRLAADRAKSSKEATDEGDLNIADLLVEVAGEAVLFHDSTPNAYASVKVDDHFENYAVRSKAFRMWLRRRLREEYQRSAYGDAVAVAIEEIESKAIFDGPLMAVAVRVAGDEGGAIYLDLADASWRAVRITKDGWTVEDNPTVRFIRPRGLLPLPIPIRGGSINDLRPFLNVANESDFVLIVAWTLAAFKPKGPYPILAVNGEQGTGKSTAQRIVKATVDPNVSPLRSEPKEPRDLMVAAGNSWALGFDNLSKLATWLSDALCRLSTGGGFAARELYSDRDETIFEAQRPILYNGIEDVANRSDLLDRCLLINLTPITEDQRRPEKDLWLAFNAARPRILGALLDAVAAGLRNEATIKLDKLPRMADFAVWVAACETGLGWKAGTFMSAYMGNREGANESAIEASPIGAIIQRMISERSDAWIGTATDLLKVLEGLLPIDRNGKPLCPHGWPKNSRSVAGDLRRIAPNLRAIGLNVVFEREGHGRKRTINIVKTAKFASAPSAASADPETEAILGDPPARPTVRVTSAPYSENLNFDHKTAIADDADGADDFSCLIPETDHGADAVDAEDEEEVRV